MSLSDTELGLPVFLCDFEVLRQELSKLLYSFLFVIGNRIGWSTIHEIIG